jgi:hypothetical protein
MRIFFSGFGSAPAETPWLPRDAYVLWITLDAAILSIPVTTSYTLSSSDVTHKLEKKPERITFVYECIQGAGLVNPQYGMPLLQHADQLAL